MGVDSRPLLSTVWNSGIWCDRQRTSAWTWCYRWPSSLTAHCLQFRPRPLLRKGCWCLLAEKKLIQPALSKNLEGRLRDVWRSLRVKLQLVTAAWGRRELRKTGTHLIAA